MEHVNVTYIIPQRVKDYIDKILYGGNKWDILYIVILSGLSLLIYYKISVHIYLPLRTVRLYIQLSCSQYTIVQLH